MKKRYDRTDVRKIRPAPRQDRQTNRRTDVKLLTSIVDAVNNTSYEVEAVNSELKWRHTGCKTERGNGWLSLSRSLATDDSMLTAVLPCTTADYCSL